jgi:hypothetical protein
MRKVNVETAPSPGLCAGRLPLCGSAILRASARPTPSPAGASCRSGMAWRFLAALHEQRHQTLRGGRRRADGQLHDRAVQTHQVVW